LDAGAFVSGNSNIGNSFYTWDGDLNTGIDATVSQVLSNGNRYTVSAGSSSSTGDISPLQSFFVQKGTFAEGDNLLISPEWTSVTPASPYVLRATEPARSGVLRIKATQGSKTSYAALLYDVNAGPDFNIKDDAATLFYDEIGLTLHSLTPQQKALSINTNGRFSAQPTYLGVRAKDAGEIKLEFTGLSRFGHDVTLVDKQLNKTVELKEGDAYTFTVAKPSGAGAFFEVNNRISLEMVYTGKGLTGAEAVAIKTAAQVTSSDGFINVRSFDVINSLQVYSLSGALIYSNNTPSTEYRIPATRHQMYIVRVQTGDTNQTEKIIVK
jgi:hypothetical protein